MSNESNEFPQERVVPGRSEGPTQSGTVPGTPAPRVEIACVEMVIDNEIAQGLNQRQIAQTYALAIRSSWPTDWKHVNEAIVKRWSASGLARIKNMAWSGKCFN